MADKYIYNNAGTLTERSAITTSAGAGDSGKIPAVGAGGTLDASFMPPGIAADTSTLIASEALAAGDLVNVYNASGPKVRKADATTAGKEAHGFVIAAVLNAGSATVYFEGTNAFVTGMTAGVQYLTTTAGISSSTPPSGTGNVVQRIGIATSTTSLNFEASVPIVLA